MISRLFLLGIVTSAFSCAASRQTLPLLAPATPADEATARRLIAEGDGYMAASKFNEAILAYNEVLVMPAATSLRPLAIYREAEGFERLGDPADAAHLRQKLASEYPAFIPPTGPEAGVPQQVVVTAGNLSRPYEILGPVHIDTAGTINLGGALSDALFKSPLERAAGGSTPTIRPDRAYEVLRQKAVETYGPRVDAVINATYRAEHSGTVYADGIAVQFTGGTEAASMSTGSSQATAERLREVKALLDQGLISQKEYEAKRAEILREL